MRLARLYLTLVFAFVQAWAIAQKPDKEQEQNNIIEQRIEQLAESEEEGEETDYTTLFDNLTYYYEKKLNLNQADAEELSSLMLLSDFQINSLLDHIDRYGKLISIYELQAIEGFDLSTIRTIEPFVRVSAELDALHISFKDLFRNAKHELFVRHQRILEEQEGYSPIEDTLLAENPNRRYLGSKDKIFTRYRFKYRTNISVGFTAEKDAGEEFFKGSQPNGYDFYSAHAYIKGIGKIKALAIGDYQLQLGQGLTFWSGLALRKSFDVMNMKKNAPGIRPYTSVNENLFLRGGAATVGLGDFNVTGFYSRKGIDANISTESVLDNEEAEASSFLQSGFHRTPNELEDKNSIGETHYGGNVNFKRRKFQIGATAVQSDYSVRLNPRPSTYNQFYFSGNSNLLLGADYSMVLRNFNLFGEVARSESGGMAFLQGALISLDPRLAVSLFYRNYERDYQSLHSNAIRESSRTQNEEGIFMGMQFKATSRLTFYTYFDRFEFPWLRFAVSAPSSGYDFLGQANYNISKKIKMYFRYRHREKPRDTRADIDDIDFLVFQSRETIRYDITYQLNDALRFRNRIELADYRLADQDPDRGFMVLQDVTYKPLSSPIAITARYALFDTESWDSRIYAYENDVLYAYSIPAYYRKGSRAYFMLRWTTNKHIDIWLRYAQYLYNNTDVIGSGLEEIQGRRRSEIKAQLRLRF